jgi:5-formyltetrahydrofolate cyclo-ligase
MDKKLFRKYCLEKLRQISPRAYYKKDKIVMKQLCDEIRRVHAHTIMLYIPLGIEVDIMPLIKRLKMQKKILYVPFMQGESFRLVQYKLPLETRQFGICEPRHSQPSKIIRIDLAIVPAIGIDSAMRRIGFGKGMYDRFYEKEQTKIKKIVFVSRVLCRCRHKITDHYDIQADKMITPEKIVVRKRERRFKVQQSSVDWIPQRI